MKFCHFIFAKQTISLLQFEGICFSKTSILVSSKIFKTSRLSQEVMLRTMDIFESMYDRGLITAFFSTTKQGECSHALKSCTSQKYAPCYTVLTGTCSFSVLLLVNAEVQHVLFLQHCYALLICPFSYLAKVYNLKSSHSQTENLTDLSGYKIQELGNYSLGGKTLNTCY